VQFVALRNKLIQSTRSFLPQRTFALALAVSFWCIEADEAENDSSTLNRISIDDRDLLGFCVHIAVLIAWL
jgi:hypothetical protein